MGGGRLSAPGAGAAARKLRTEGGARKAGRRRSERVQGLHSPASSVAAAAPPPSGHAPALAGLEELPSVRRNPPPRIAGLQGKIRASLHERQSMATLEDAIALAVEAHRGQKDKVGA